jgi:hypothetical protein
VQLCTHMNVDVGVMLLLRDAVTSYSPDGANRTAIHAELRRFCEALEFGAWRYVRVVCYNLINVGLVSTHHAS